MDRSAFILRRFWFLAVLLVFFGTVAVCRPLLPVDETRYMTVAWEMYLRHGWFHPMTLNFEPYHHKPPLMFWAINLVWAIFGVSRAAALIVPVAASGFCIYLTAQLGRLLFPDILAAPRRVMMVMVAGVPLILYGTLMMFDFLLCDFVLLALIAMIHFVRDRKWPYVIGFGLAVGMGVLAKGPVAYLYVLPPVLLAPVWMPNLSRRGAYYGACGVGVLISAVPVLIWLIPVLLHANKDFAFWLVWNQTAGRVTGNFSESHVRPIYFYVPLIPVLFLPWVLFPSFWRGFAGIKGAFWKDQGLRFLTCWFVPVVIAFSFISGKQPHYLVPLFPACVLVIAIVLRAVSTVDLARVVGGMVILFVGVHGVAAQTVFRYYDLGPVARIVADHADRDWAFVQNYHGEMGFMARLTRPMEQRELSDIQEWFAAHPNGMAVIRYRTAADVPNLRSMMTFDYRGNRMGVFTK